MSLIVSFDALWETTPPTYAREKKQTTTVTQAISGSAVRQMCAIRDLETTMTTSGTLWGV